MSVIARRDLLLVFSLSAIGILGGYLSGFGMLDKHLLIAMGSYMLLLYFIASLLLRSLKKAFYVLYTAFITVLTLSLLHLLMFPRYDSIAHISYFVILLLSYLLNLYLIYDFRGESLYTLYKKKKPVIASLIVSVMLVSFLITSQEILYYFGVLCLVGAALAYLELIFLLSPLLRIDSLLSAVEKATEEEKRVRKFVQKYGKAREVYPFYATWLGVAVREIENIIDSLEAKGYLGHNFFALQNPFYWFIVLLSFALGAEAAGGSFLHILPFALLFLLGIAFLGPQAFLARRVRRLLGLLFLLSALLLIYIQSLSAFKIAAASSILALVSIYFAYRDDEVVSIIFASFFVGSLYLISYALFKPLYIHNPHPWLITFAVFFLLMYDLFLKSQTY